MPFTELEIPIRSGILLLFCQGGGMEGLICDMFSLGDYSSVRCR